MRRREPMPAHADMNLTNLIDIIFAILVVFMITAPLMSQGVKVDLPKEQAASIDEKKAVHITITKEREVIINETPTSQSDFSRDFRAIWDGDLETAVIINSDQSVPYGYVMTFVTQAQREGVKRLGFLTDPSVRTVRAK